MSSIIVVENSTITGIHKTKNGASEFIAMNVIKDDTIGYIDPDSMRVMFPSSVSSAFLKEITYPKKKARKRFQDQLAEDILGKKVGNVPANLCGLFRSLLDSGSGRNIKCFASSGSRLRPSRNPASQKKFKKGLDGQKDRRDGGLVLDCRYELSVQNRLPQVINKVKEFLEHHDGDETLAQS